MALRIKSRWPKRRLNTVTDEMLAENAVALAFIAWRMSLEYARNLHGEGFDYLSDHERIGVITEYVAFFVQCADRLVHERLNARQRSVFVNALGARLADQIDDNLNDIAGPGAYRQPFIALLNRRLADYATLTFTDEPGYDNLRYFGKSILALMGESQTNRWVIDQIMDIDGPQAFEKLSDALKNLLESGHPELSADV